MSQETIYDFWATMFKVALWIECRGVWLRDLAQRKKLEAMKLEHQSSYGW